MSEWLSNHTWILGYVSCFLMGMATVMGWRLYNELKEDRAKAKEQRLLERGPAYDADADVERITGGWNLPRPVSPGSVTVIAPSPLAFTEPSGGYATVGVIVPKPNVDQRYATLSTLSWLDRGSVTVPTARGKARVLRPGEGRHRTENVYTSEISLEAIMERIEMENEWRASSTGQLTLSASAYATAR